MNFKLYLKRTVRSFSGKHLNQNPKIGIRQRMIDARIDQNNLIQTPNQSFGNSHFIQNLETERENFRSANRNNLSQNSHTLEKQLSINDLIKRKMSGNLPSPFQTVGQNNIKVQRFILGFSRRLKSLDANVKNMPFTEKCIEIEQQTIEFMYNHIFGQIFHLKSEHFMNNPVELFNHMQSAMRGAITRMLEEVEDISLNFQTPHFMEKIGHEVLSIAKKFEYDLKHLSLPNLHFAPYYMVADVKGVELY